MIKYIQPKIKENYDVGYIGFTRDSDSLISKGITFFTGGDAIVAVSHCFIVINEQSGIEADWYGVQMFPLKKYFDDTSIDVFFKKPIGYCDEAAGEIATEAFLHIGAGYDYSDIAGFFVRAVTAIEKLPYLRLLPSVFNSKDKWICSELVSQCLITAGYGEHAPLNKYHISKISPQMLFDSRELFESWKVA